MDPSLLEDFKEYVAEKNLCHGGERVLLSASGGVDSMVLWHLAECAGWDYAVAHCNYQLRGAASDGDEDLVRDLAEERGVPVFVETFNTREIAASRNISIQMACRDLRYAWLEQVRREQGFHRIATAHHLDDSIETVLYNFVKGTGIRGLHGIPVRRDHIIRPLLFSTKQRLLNYAFENGLSYREDASNIEDKYARNKLRHHVLPVFRELNPAFERTAAANLERFRQAEYLYHFALEKIAEKIRERDGDSVIINIEELLAHYQAAPTILFELLRPCHFNADQVAQILESVGRQPGGLFYSDDFQLLIDRETLIISPRIIDSGEDAYSISEGVENVYLPDGNLNIILQSGRPEDFPAGRNRALLDADALKFPLRLRHWRAGDVFYPLGMGGRRQKLQDFFTNNKVPRLTKDQIWLLETADERICWVIGYRVDERFKITPETRDYFELNFSPHAGI